MNNNTNVTINESIELPSLGKFPDVPASITLRAMSLLDEKKRLASSGVRGLVNLINSCTLSPEGFDAGKLCRFDLDYAMLSLRIISHGPNYKIATVCPNCGHKHEEVINLSELPCNQVDDKFSPSFEMQLPVKGDTLKVHILNYNELEAVESEARRIMSKFPNYEGNPVDILTYIYKIDEVNGEKMPYAAKKPYVENLSAADSIYFDQVYDSKLGSYGLDTQLSLSCDNCGNNYVRNMPINEEFFRPRYNTI